MSNLTKTRKRGRRSNTHADFLSRVVINPANGCMEWTGPTKHGYGQFIINGVWWLTHRYSYSYHKGEVQDKKVCHSCDNPLCVNPEHLFLGTQAENIADCKRKGRYGKNMKQKALSLAQVETIRALLNKGEPLKEIAVQYNVSKGTISNINNRRYWTDN